MSDFSVLYLAPFVILISVVFGYLLGSIPFGLVLTRAAGLGDVRQIGSGNIGATNVLRTGNKKLAAATLLLDAFKGTVAVWIIAFVFDDHSSILAGLAAFIGHLFPVWLGFKGGKGVATYEGILVGLAPWMALLFAVIWLSIAVITRYSSLSALVATLAIPIVLLLLGHYQLGIAVAIMTVIIWWKHKANIIRLLNKTESKIGAK